MSLDLFNPLSMEHSSENDELSPMSNKIININTNKLKNDLQEKNIYSSFENLSIKSPNINGQGRCFFITP